MSSTTSPLQDAAVAFGDAAHKADADTTAALGNLVGTVDDHEVRIAAIEAALKLQPPPPPTPVVSPDGSIVVAGALGAALTFASGNTYIITSGGQIALKGVVDPVTSGVARIAKGNAGRTLYQQNTGGEFYAMLDGTPMGQWTEIIPSLAGPLAPAPVVVVPPVPGTGYRVSGGQILDPSGKPWLGRGCALLDDRMSSVPASFMKQLLPNLSFIRLAVGGDNNGFFTAQPTAAIVAWVNAATALGIVVYVENHLTGQPPALTGANLTAESVWFTTLANAFKSNPMAWLGTANEVLSPGVSAQHLASYKAIRATGNNNPIIMCVPGGNPVLPDDPSVYASMTNVVFDQHWYNWMDGGTTDQNAANAKLASIIAGLSPIKSADGVIPVIIGETGHIDYVGGDTNANPNGGAGTDQIIAAAMSAGVPYAYWMFDNPWNDVSRIVDRATGKTLTRDGQFVLAHMV